MAVLHYFDGRGRAEVIRLMLCSTNIKFTESFLKTKNDYLKLVEDGKLLFKQVPMLEIDGKCLVQTNAILRYIEEKGDMTAKSLEDRYRVNMLFEASRDFQVGFLPIGFLDKAEVLKKTEESLLPKMLPIFEKELETTQSGYLVGGSMTLADVGLLEPLLSCLDYFGCEVFKQYSNIQKYVDFLKSQDNIQHYMKNVRKRPNDDQYIKEVQTSLGKLL